MTEARFELTVAPTARRQLAEQMPEAVAFAAYEVIVGPLLDDPHRVGKPWHAPLEGRHSARRGTCRVIYRIDELGRQVLVLGVFASIGRAPFALIIAAWRLAPIRTRGVPS